MSFLQQVANDSATTVTCVAGAFLGAGAATSASYIINAAGGSTGTGLGGMGINFVVNAVTAAAFYNLGQRYFPETSANIAFAFLFFSADAPLIRAGVGVGQAVVNILTDGIARSLKTSPPISSADNRRTKKSCGTGTCGQ